MTMVVKGVRMTSIYTTYIYSVRPPHGVLAGVGRVVRKLTHDASHTRSQGHKRSFLEFRTLKG